MYASILPLALGFSLLFNPIVTSQEGLFIWLIVFACISRVSISMFFIPHVALGAELSVDFQERTSIVGYRQVFSILGGATVVLLGFAIRRQFDRHRRRRAASRPALLRYRRH